MTDYSQLYLVWPPIAILLIGLVAGWFLQRHVLVRQMEELETQHLDLLRSAEDEMHAARDEARLQSQKLDEAQMAITLGYERLTLLDRRLKEAESRIPAELPGELLAAEPAAGAEVAAQEEVRHLRQELAQQQVFAERLTELERDLAIAKAEASAPVAAIVVSTGEDLERALHERDATIKSLRYEVAVVEELRLRLSDMVSELGLAQSQVAQITRERNELKVRAAALAVVPAPTVAPAVAGTVPAVESSNELVRKLADAIARRQELELALGAAKQQLMGAYAERDRALAMHAPAVAPRAMAAAAGAGAGSSSGSGLGFSVSNWQAAFPATLVPLHPPLAPPATPAPATLPARPFLTDDSDGDYVAPVCPLLSPSQLTGGISQLLFENRIQFAPDRADILPDSKLLLEDIADLILSSDPVRFVIEGHTERGDARASFYLSERRAMAVLERLAKLGVPESRMLSVGYGDTRPIDENSSYEGRMRNRRVEIRVLGRA